MLRSCCKASEGPGPSSHAGTHRQVYTTTLQALRENFGEIHGGALFGMLRKAENIHHHRWVVFSYLADTSRLKRLVFSILTTQARWYLLTAGDAYVFLQVPTV